MSRRREVLGKKDSSEKTSPSPLRVELKEDEDNITPKEQEKDTVPYKRTYKTTK